MVRSPPTIEVHHAQDSQVIGDGNASSMMDSDWEKTLTASEYDDDQMITPAQRLQDPVLLTSTPDQTEEIMETNDMDQDEWDENDKKRKAHGSSDEDSIVMQIGSFVNSLWSDSKEKKEAKKVKKVDVQTM